MNRSAYRTTGLAIKTLASILKAKVSIHGQELIPKGGLIFAINHFTRMETLVLPYHIFRLTGIPVWSLADASLFSGAMASFFDKVGVVSTENPDRDLLMVKSLLTGEAHWIIYPEGRMVKSKKIIEKGRFMVAYAGGKHPPHTGAATLALRTEFYRRRLQFLADAMPEEAKRLLERFRIPSAGGLMNHETFIVPVNITYYPLRARENILTRLASRLVDGLPERFIEELMTEGSMLLSGVDVDIRFGPAIGVAEHLRHTAIRRDIQALHPIRFDDPIPSRGAMRKAALVIMQRYMTAIYGMTTVNPDHLFASILKMMPRRRIFPQDLRRRVYLVSSRDLGALGVSYHRSLEADQLHLLTDDCFHRYRDFIAVACAKGIIQEREGILVKVAQKFTSRFDFHRVRLENPVVVMANELEPLVRLQRRLRWLAWAPGCWVRRQVVRRLRRKATEDFEADYRRFHLEGESKPMAAGRPFLLRAARRAIGVLLIHGYMASPLEVRPLAEYLARRGLWVYAPRVAGHGTAPEDLALRTQADWVASVEQGYALLANSCRKVVVGGFSNGAGLALDLAARMPGVAGVVAVSPPLRLRDFSARFVPAMDVWNRILKKVHPDGGHREFIPNHPENPHINYLRNPVSGIRELERLMERVEERLPSIQAPALVIQSRGDPVVDPRGSQKVFERLGSEDKQYLLFNVNRHGILLGAGSSVVHAAIGDFIGRIQTKP